MSVAASIEINQVTKIFPGKGKNAGWKALDGATFSVNPGEFVCILGPSGCGKSTLLNILSGLDDQYEGVASIHGRPVGRRTYDGTRIAYLSAASDGSTQLFVYWFGSNVSAPISHFTESPTSLAWSPDGRWLAFTMPAPAERKPLKVELPQAPKGAS